MTPKPQPLSPVDPPQPMPAQPVSPQPQVWQAAPRDPMELVQRAALGLALVFLAISLAVAYYSANSIVSIWFEHRYVPIVRLVLALGIAAVAVWSILRLTRKR